MGAVVSVLLILNSLLDLALVAAPFVGHSLQKELLHVTLKGTNELLARQYSHVFLVHALIRFAAGRYGGSNATLRSLAVASYLIEIAFAAAEVFVYKTNPLNYFVGTAAICGTMALLVQLTLVSRKAKTA